MLRLNVACTLLRQHIDGVARASSAGTKSGSIAHSLVLLTILALVSRSARLGDQLGLDDEANAKIADRYATGSSARRGVAVGDLPTSSAGAPQLVPRTLCSARTPPVRLYRSVIPVSFLNLVRILYSRNSNIKHLAAAAQHSPEATSLSGAESPPAPQPKV